MSHPTAEIIVGRDANTNLGYRTRLRVTLRGKKKFLLAVQRSLLQHEVDSIFYKRESKHRPRPVLRITGIKNLRKFIDVFHSDISNIDWNSFSETLSIVESKKHLTAQGFDKILSMKGVL